jgi:hypothetical protein
VLVLGDEGTGKSWLVAKGWSASQPAPLLAVFMATELSMPQAMSNMEELLIAKLSSHADNSLTDDVRPFQGLACKYRARACPARSMGGRTQSGARLSLATLDRCDGQIPGRDRWSIDRYDEQLASRPNPFDADLVGGPYIGWRVV